MEYRKLGGTGMFVSELCLGTMQFGWTTDEETSYRIMDAFLDGGGNFIDTADIYSFWVPESYGGKTEEIIGRWMKSRGNREKVVLATKVRGEMWDGPNGEGLSRLHIMRAVEDSLRRLQTDYIDLYQTHWVDLNTPIEETLLVLDDLVKQGKVRYLGASNYPAWRLMEALATSTRLNLARFDSYQPEYSLMERQLFEYEAMPLCKHYKVGVIPYSPLAGGFLTGKYRKDHPVPASARAKGNLEKYGNDQGYAVIDTLEAIGQSHGKTVAQTALAWQLTNPVVTSPIIGANTVEQLDDTLKAAGYRLSDEEMANLNEATKWPKNWRPIWD